MVGVAVDDAVGNKSTGFAGGGILGATVTVLITTLDDAIWLIPLLLQQHQQPDSFAAASSSSSSSGLSRRWFHAMLFVATLEVLSMTSVGVAWLLSKGIVVAMWWGGGNETTTTTTNTSHNHPSHDDDQDLEEQQQQEESFVLGIVGALLCWIIALALFIKKQCKNIRRIRETKNKNTSNNNHNNETIDNNNEILGSSRNKNDDNNDYGTMDNENAEQDYQEEQQLISDATASKTLITPWTVISLTTLGALDEMSYLPALVVGNVFTPVDVCVGTFLAAILMLLLVTCCCGCCCCCSSSTTTPSFLRPVLSCLDRIPLYGIVAMFAVALSFNTAWDWISNRHPRNA